MKIRTDLLILLALLRLDSGIFIITNALSQTICVLEVVHRLSVVGWAPPTKTYGINHKITVVCRVGNAYRAKLILLNITNLTLALSGIRLPVGQLN